MKPIGCKTWSLTFSSPIKCLIVLKESIQTKLKVSKPDEGNQDHSNNVYHLLISQWKQTVVCPAYRLRKTKLCGDEYGEAPPKSKVDNFRKFVNYQTVSGIVVLVRYCTWKWACCYQQSTTTLTWNIDTSKWLIILMWFTYLWLTCQFLLLQLLLDWCMTIKWLRRCVQQCGMT